MHPLPYFYKNKKIKQPTLYFILSLNCCRQMIDILITRELCLVFEYESRFEKVTINVPNYIYQVLNPTFHTYMSSLDGSNSEKYIDYPRALFLEIFEK